MFRVRVICVFLLWGVVLCDWAGALSSTLCDQVTEVLQERISILKKEQGSVPTSRKLSRAPLVERFYASRAFQPAWSKGCALRPEVEGFIKVLQRVDTEGFDPEDYSLRDLETLLGKAPGSAHSPDPAALADLDLLLTDAFFAYASDLSVGRVDPDKIHLEWFIRGQKPDIVEILETALSKGEIQKTLEDLGPRDEDFHAMQHYLLQYENIMKSGGWSRVDHGPLLRKGDRGGRVSQLQSRLIVSGDLEAVKGSNDLFDEDLEHAVERFQKRHGLEIDGIVGLKTLAALNVPVEGRIRQIKLNMERWRWLPHNLGPRHILVNIANFGLKVIEDDKTVLSMSGVVGRKSRPTPVFTSKMRYVELNPYWHIPSTIAREDVLPKILEDPQYLAKENIRVFKGWDPRAPEIDPETVDWTQIGTDYFPFRLRQEPGDSNPLGRIKFVFPNKFEVYLHDTPAKQLFEKTERSFSSGCIRIEKPIDLAEYLLQSDQRWSRERILSEIDKGKNQIVNLPEPIDVDVLYLTAWVDEAGNINFREDIYGLDEILNRSLQEKTATQ